MGNRSSNPVRCRFGRHTTTRRQLLRGCSRERPLDDARFSGGARYRLCGDRHRPPIALLSPMPVTRIQQEHHWSIRLEGELRLNCAAELKQLLLEGLAGGKDLELDLESAAEIDVVIL